MTESINFRILFCSDVCDNDVILLMVFKKDLVCELKCEQHSIIFPFIDNFILEKKFESEFMNLHFLAAYASTLKPICILNVKTIEDGIFIVKFSTFSFQSFFSLFIFLREIFAPNGSVWIFFSFRNQNVNVNVNVNYGCCLVKR